MSNNKRIYFTKTNEVGIVIEDEEEELDNFHSGENSIIIEEIYFDIKLYIKNNNIPIADKFSFGDLQQFIEKNF
jgi:hypothetical protein